MRRKFGEYVSLPHVSRLSDLDVLVLDCQATAAAPRGHLLEIGWGRAGATASQPITHLIALPECGRIPPAVVRITGLTDRKMRDGVDAQLVWRELLADAAAFAQQPAPTIIHFARFEQPFLHQLSGGVPPLDIACTHEIARRLLPELPRRSLRALTGYFGQAVGVLRRSAEHVAATSFVWRELVRLLAGCGVMTWDAMREWLAAPARPSRRTSRVWPMPRDVRLSLPHAPGIYRMQRTSGDVLYVGKAASLHDRVNSYFRKQHGVSERMLEMLSQARAISYALTPSVLEAALLETDEIKRHRPPYNVALTLDDRSVWFTSEDLSARSTRPSSRFPLGPFLSSEMLEQFVALARLDRSALGRGRWAPEETAFSAGYACFCAAHVEMSRTETTPHARLLRLGTRLWHEGRRDREDPDETALGTSGETSNWTPGSVQLALERLALRAALARRRALWLTKLLDASLVWSEPVSTGARLLIIQNGDVVVCAAVDRNVEPPMPSDERRPSTERRAVFTVARADRLRVLTTELKRLSAAGAPVALRLDRGPALLGANLARALWWL